MKLYYDLHTHTVWSDGELEPGSLVASAAAAGVRVLALTDHDTMAGVDEAACAARHCGIQLIPGVELSVAWQGLTVHVVGLGLDAGNARLRQALAAVRETRIERGRAMAAALAAAGLLGAQSVLERPGIVSRVHVADWLVAHGHAPDRARAFKRFLTRGMPGYVVAQWPDLTAGVDSIRGAGGCAVLAHPIRYRLSGGRLEQLVRAFTEAGGVALEVVTAGLDAGEIGRLARLARRYALHASVGSDFDKALPWRLRPGGLPELPGDCRPVWDGWPGIVSREIA